MLWENEKKKKKEKKKYLQRILVLCSKLTIKTLEQGVKYAQS